jgi:sugar lactone lactonase YvrE
MVISRIHLAQCVLAFLAGVIVSEASAQTLTTGSLERQTRPLSATAPTGPSGILTTVAGDGYPGDYGNGGMAVDAEFAGPQGIAVDGAGNLYVADSYAEVVRKVTASTGIITAFAGSGVGGYAGDGGPATSAALSFPTNVTVDAAGNVYIADSDNNVVRMVDAKTGIISTVAGDGLGAGPPSDHACRAYTDGLAATSASLCFPRGLAVDGAGNLYIGDTRQHRILVRNAKTGILTTVAGTGSTGYSGDGGLAVNAAISAPQQIAVDSTGNLYIADGGNCTIRKVTDGVIRTLVGAGPPATCGLAGDSGPASMAQMNYAYGVSVDAAGNVFIADGYNALIRMIAASTGNIYTVAGSYVPGASYGNLGFLGAGGPAVNGELYFPISAVVDNKDTLYLVDFYNYVVQAVNEAQVLPTESPAIAPVTGSIAKATTITITSPVKDSALYYTTNGTLPTTSSSKYTEPFSVAKTAVITAFATISGQPNTGASVSAYLYVPAPAITPGTETIHKATSVTINDADTKAQIYYTTDGSDPTAGGVGVALYTAPVSLTGTATLQAAAYSSATDSGGNLYSAWSPVVSATYTLVPLVVATPTFSLASGTYAKAQTVTLKDATAGLPSITPSMTRRQPVTPADTVRR